MKKLLALVMALVMSIGLVTIGTNAAFNDADKIEHKEAVQIMASLGILAGKEDGNFDPQGTLTRAEAAKILSYMLIGTESACKLTSNGTEFTDVAPEHWAAPYIAYCNAQGIINGNGDGTFDPEGKLTGYAFAKMILVAIGFDGDYTGSAWQANVAADLDKTEKQSAEKKGLKEELKNIVLGNEISRDEAAQMALNGLFFADKDTSTYKVVLHSGAEGTYGNVESKEFDSYQDAYTYMLACGVEAADNKQYDIYGIETEGQDTLAEDNFGVQRAVETVIYANQATSLNEYTSTYAGDFNYETGADMIGHVVDVYFEDFWDESIDEIEDQAKTFTMVDKTTVVEVPEGTEALSKNAVKSLLGVNKSLNGSDIVAFDPELTLLEVYNSCISDTIRPIEVNEDDTTKYDLEAGKYFTYETEDGDVYAYAYAAEEPVFATFEVELTDEDNKYYTVSIDEYPVVVVDEDEDDCFNTVNEKIDWLSYIGKGDGNEDRDDIGAVVFETKSFGYFGGYDTDDVAQFRLSVKDVQTVTGAVTKTTTNTTKEIYKIYVDGTAYDYRPASEGCGCWDCDVVLDNIYEMSDEVYATGHGDLNFNRDKNIIFFLLDGEIAAWAYEDNSTDAQMFVPVKFCAIDTIEDSTNEYGDDDVDAIDEYEFFIQGVDANGEEVKIELDIEDLLDKNDNVNLFSDNFVNFFFGSSDANYILSNGFSSGDDYTDKANAIAKNLWTKRNASFFTDNVVFYADDSKMNFNYTTFTVDPEDADEEVVEYLASGAGLTKDSKRITAGGKTFLLGDGYSVIKYSGTGSKLKISTSENTYTKLNQGAVLYGTKDKNAKNFTLKYAFVVAEDQFTTDELVFVAADFTADSSESIKYHDKNDREQSATVYNEEIYVGAEKKSINVLASELNTTPGFYNYKIDEYDGTYKLTPVYTDIKVACGVEAENGGITFTWVDNTTLEDVDLGNALIVNTTEYDFKTSNLGNDTKHNYFAFVKFDGEDVESVYVYKVTPKITLKYLDGGEYVEADTRYDSVDDEFEYLLPGIAETKIVKTTAQGFKGIAADDYAGNKFTAQYIYDNAPFGFTVTEKNCDEQYVKVIVDD